MVTISDLSHPIVWLVGHVRSDKAEFSFFAKEDRFLMLFQTCTKLTFAVSDILVITFIARNRINSVSSLFFRDRILKFGKNIVALRSENVLSNLDGVAIQNSLDGFRKTLYVKNNSKTNR